MEVGFQQSVASERRAGSRVQKLPNVQLCHYTVRQTAGQTKLTCTFPHDFKSRLNTQWSQGWRSETRNFISGPDKITTDIDGIANTSFSYELKHRIHCARAYPLTAPNGSTIILYGHDRGLRLLWRGGHARRGGDDVDDAMIMDGGSDNDRDQAQAQSDSEDDDPDRQFPVIIQDVDIALGAEVLRIEVPPAAQLRSPHSPSISTTHVMVVASCSDSRILVFAIPLIPPRPGSEQRYIDEDIAMLELEGDGTIAQSLSIKVVPHDIELRSPPRTTVNSDVRSEGRLLVVAATSKLVLWDLGLTSEAISQSRKGRIVALLDSHSGNVVHFHSAERSGQLLLAGRRGDVRVFDAFAADGTWLPNQNDRASNDSRDFHNRFIISLQTPFESQSDNATMARRRKILAAAWVLGGRAIFVLLEDGGWGIWDLYGASQNGKGLSAFALQGYLDSTSAPEHVESGKPKRYGAKLAPMTPNTRKAKADDLFSGHSRAIGLGNTGSISTSSITDRGGRVDESVVVWYNNGIYSIPSMQAFWQRSTSGGGSGSLYTPGLAHITDVDLMNENITSISQFASSANASSLGQMNLHKDLLVSAEHRLVLLQSIRSGVPPKRLFQQELAARSVVADQQMLDAGDLDIQGIDRMLGEIGNGRSRRVGFAV